MMQACPYCMGGIHYQNQSSPQVYPYPPFSPTNQQLMEMLGVVSKQVQEILDLLKKNPGSIVPRGY
jgi:hypothetical protein